MVFFTVFQLQSTHTLQTPLHSELPVTKPNHQAQTSPIRHLIYTGLVSFSNPTVFLAICTHISPIPQRFSVAPYLIRRASLPRMLFLVSHHSPTIICRLSDSSPCLRSPNSVCLYPATGDSMNTPIEHAHRTRIQSDSSSSMSIRSETRLPVVTHSHLVSIPFRLVWMRGLAAYVYVTARESRIG